MFMTGVDERMTVFVEGVVDMLRALDAAQRASACERGVFFLLETHGWARDEAKTLGLCHGGWQCAL